MKVDLAKDVRPVKPMHAVGQLGLRDYQLFRLLKEAGVPFVLELCGRAGARPSPGSRVRECRITDETRTNEIIPLPTMLPPHSFLVVLIDPDQGK